MYKIINAILYKLKTGVQWRYLPMRELFGTTQYSWKSVYHHFSKWSKVGAWDEVWIKLLETHKNKLDMSCVQLDGSHTPVKRGGVAVGYQGRKKCKTTNMLLLTDNGGIPLCCSNPVAGNHSDCFELEQHTDKIFNNLHKATIPTEGLFLNADAGFDTENFRTWCTQQEVIGNIPDNKRNSKHEDKDHLLDELLYARRFVIERTNAWIDAFKNLLVRFDTSDVSWKAWHVIAFAVILLRTHEKL